MARGKLTECGQRARRCARSDWLDHSEWTARGGKVVSGHYAYVMVPEGGLGAFGWQFQI